MFVLPCFLCASSPPSRSSYSLAALWRTSVCSIVDAGAEGGGGEGSGDKVPATVSIQMLPPEKNPPSFEYEKYRT